MPVNNPNVTTKGQFLAGTSSLFFFNFPDINGDLFDPSEITITITAPSGAAVESSTSVEKITTGQYAFEWDIPTTATIGLYTLKVDFIVEESTGSTVETFTEEFVVAGAETTFTNQTVLAFRSALEGAWLGHCQRIPVFNETGRLNRGKDTAMFSFPRWNQPAGIRLFLNGELTDFEYDVDFQKGRITFDNTLSQYDHVTCDYNFRWFSDTELDLFLEQAVEIFNQYPPHSAVSLITIASRYGITVIEQAAVFALRRLIFDLNHQQPAKVYGGQDRVDNAIKNFETLKQNYENELKDLYEAKKYQPYYGLHKTIVVPEFTLPGGRCIAYYSSIAFCPKTRVLSKNALVNHVDTSSYIISDSSSCMMSEDIEVDTIENLYNRWKDGEEISVLSDKEGELSFQPVTRIWESGRKKLIRIVAASGDYVDVSEEHIMFVNGSEMPACQIQVNDILYITLGEKITTSPVKEIKHISRTKTFDIEVPTTRNLFVDNIKCHNSRWFRMLFKTAILFFPLLLMF